MSDPSQPAAAPSRAKGILLRHGSKGQHAHLRWDEPTIAEHDKLRGTRMKIDEEKTPYNYEMPPDEEPAAPSAQANGSAQQADAWGALGGDLPGGDGDWESDDDDEVVPPAPAPAPAAAVSVPAPASAGSAGPAAAGAAAGTSQKSGFAAARRAHYAEEVVNMKALLASGGAMADLDDDDDADDDDDDDDDDEQDAKK